MANYCSNSVLFLGDARSVKAVHELFENIQKQQTKNDRYYFWYMNKVIHSTQGGYTGQLLNGHYIAFYPDKNLKEEGNFKAGLKDGVWKTWDQKGNLNGVSNWDEGIEVPLDQSIWKKIPFLNKKDAQAPPTKN